MFRFVFSYFILCTPPCFPVDVLLFRSASAQGALLAVDHHHRR